MKGIILVAVVPQPHLLAALSNDTERWLKHAVKLLHRHRLSSQMKPFERLNNAVFMNGASNPCNKFLAAGLQPLCFPLCLMIDYVHEHCFTSLVYISYRIIQSSWIILQSLNCSFPYNESKNENNFAPGGSITLESCSIKLGTRRNSNDGNQTKWITAIRQRTIGMVYWYGSC